jgi:hypothetical protein
MFVTRSPIGTDAASEMRLQWPVWRYAVPVTATIPKKRNTNTSPSPW